MQSKKVAILESRLGKELVDLVARRGGVPFHAPALAELPDLDPKAISSLISSLVEKPAKLMIFQTGVGTRALFAATDSLDLTEKLKELLSKSIVAARGPKPTAALKGRNVRIDRSAADPYTTREVLEAIKDIDLKKARVVIQRHGVVNVELDRALEARGAEVAEIPTYRWSLPKDTAPLEQLIGALELRSGSSRARPSSGRCLQPWIRSFPNETNRLYCRGGFVVLRRRPCPAPGQRVEHGAARPQRSAGPQRLPAGHP